MKKFLTAVYTALCDTALVFCAIVLFFALFIINSTTANLSGEVILSLFGFAAVFGIAGILNVFSEIPRAIVVIIRFIAASVGFALFVLIPFERPAGQLFVGTALFVVLYWILFIVIKLIKLPFREKKESDEDIVVD